MTNRTLLLAAALLVPPLLSAQTAWTGSWGAAPVAMTEKASGENPASTTFRDVVHLSLGGKAVRVKLSNEFGTATLTVGAVHVATSAGSGLSEIIKGTDHTVLFGGAGTVEIPAGSYVVSDPLPMPVQAFADLAVSIYVPARKSESPFTGHMLAMSTNFVAAGDATAEASLPNAKTIPSWPVLKGIDVDAGAAAHAVVVLGASVSDGYHSTPDKNLRWPDELAKRLQAGPKTRAVSVLNQGISGNRMLHDLTGPSGLARLDRDVLSQTNAKYVIISLGTNDIGRTFFPKRPGELITAEQLIWSYTQIAERAHARGMKVIAGTLNPYGGADYYNDAGEAMRQKLNEFVRTSKIFDGVADFDKATRDPVNPTRFLSAFDSGDHLHPNDAGYKAMGDCIDLTLLTK